MWRKFKIKNDRGDIDSFYAPDLMSAFKLARARWPMSDRWECLG